jgi:hypothetical protein
MERSQVDLLTHDIKAAVRVGASVGLPLAALYLAGRLDLAVFGAFGGLASLYGHSETNLQRIETQIVAAVFLTVTIAAAAAYAAYAGPQGMPWLLPVLLVVTVLGAGTLGAILRWVPRGEIFFVLALMVIASLPMSWGKMWQGTLVAAATGMLCVILSTVSGGHPADARKAMAALRARARNGNAALDVGRNKIAIGVTAAAILAGWLIASMVLGIPHPYWTSIAIAAVMPVLGSARVRRQTAHLILGTAAGVALGALIFAFEPGHLALLTMIVLCQTAAEFFVGRQYGLAMMFFCPLAIGMANLNVGQPWGPLLSDRFAETLLGSAIAIVAIVIRTRLLPRPGAGVQGARSIRS